MRDADLVSFPFPSLSWYEEVLRQLRQGLAKCYAIAFDTRSSVNDATITPHTLNFVKKLVSTFGVGIENVSTSSSVSSNYNSAASESLVRRAQATAQVRTVKHVIDMETAAEL